jgi:hypothetical protein
MRVFVPMPTALLTENAEAASRTLLSGLADLGEDVVVVRWALRPGAPSSLRYEEPLNRVQREVERTWRQKTTMTGGFQVAGLILVRSASIARARGICEHITSCLRSRRGSVSELRLTRSSLCSHC